MQCAEHKLKIDVRMFDKLFDSNMLSFVLVPAMLANSNLLCSLESGYEDEDIIYPHHRYSTIP